jgi:hypothetical protein
MKLLKYGMVLLATCSLLASCDESRFLEENPLDFYTPDNSLETSAHFQVAINFQYNQVRKIVWTINPDQRYAFWYATDFAFNATDYYKPAKLNDYTNTMTPTFSVPLGIWLEHYKMITNANVVLNRLQESTSVTEEEKNVFRAEVLFFRSYAYRTLAHLFGGVPLLLEEITTPRRDYVRATRDEVYTQVKVDLEEAIRLLPDIDKAKDGKINKQVAQHLLSEIYISLKDYDGAIQAATAVIDHPAMGLMMSRFGTRQGDEGDVYWDLFRLDNQNRSSSGNKESLWVLQYDYLNAGSATSSNMSRFVLPFYQNIKITAKDDSGKDISSNAFLGVTDGKGGRTIGWMQPTDYFFRDLWGADFDKDIRNSVHNIMRDVKIDNPASPAFGEWLVKDGYSKQLDTIRTWFPFITKASRIGNFPEDLWQKDASGSPKITPFGEHLLINSASGNYKDEYMFRLAESYLLRAEAYIGKGENAKAVADVNLIRARANATPATAAEMNIDYILDERMRELYTEELRMVTLCRLGMLVERNRKYNPKTGVSISNHHDLWPIPFSEIERNVYAVIDQNPGY